MEPWDVLISLSSRLLCSLVSSCVVLSLWPPGPPIQLRSDAGQRPVFSLLTHLVPIVLFCGHQSQIEGAE